MTDRDKVITQLESMRDYHRSVGNNITADIANEAIVLLKEQEVVKPKSKVRHGANAQIQHYCGNCNAMLHGKPKYCSECGKKVYWHDRQ